MSVGSDDTLWGIPDCFAVDSTYAWSLISIQGLSDDEDVDDTVQIVSHDPAANSSTVLEPLTAEVNF